MTIGEFIVLLIVATVLGIFAQRLIGYKLGGLLVSIFLGFVGAFLGKEMDRWLPMPVSLNLTIGHRSFPIIWSILGALLVTFVVGLIARSASKQKKRK